MSKYAVFSHKGGVRTLEVNPKDLNKNKGLKLSPLFLFTILIPKIIVHDVSFVITHARIYMCAFLFMVDLR